LQCGDGWNLQVPRSENIGTNHNIITKFENGGERLYFVIVHLTGLLMDII